MSSNGSERFAGKTIIVTGAGSGIGKATTIRLINEGARVIASDSSRERMDGLASEFGGAELTAVVGDIMRQETIGEIIASANGVVDGLANVAGVMDHREPIHELKDEVWDRVMGVNVTAVVRLMRATLPLMLDAGKGSIVNVSSAAGTRGSMAGAAYTASKHALNGLTKSSAFMYHHKGIRVNAVAPGATITNIEAPMDSAYATELFELPRLPLVPASAEDLAAPITWLLSDDSRNVTGIVLPSDGGRTAF
ncbi:SDR family NAD(P)-dependent oxidoreductase [Specibacter sp. RAF43]|uniref:SDR family NAD(P)-dependent oxidoreductase n=1 Tax=Specibacter sp. RAF43 TaxID=3233057 RepID=UPI003F9D31F8